MTSMYGCQEGRTYLNAQPAHIKCVQVTCGQAFTYDHVFGSLHGSDPGELYDRCVSPLVQGLFRGYNATVFAYGQTGSGKTYTMGSAFSPGNPSRGVIPKVMEAIFERIAATKDTTFAVRVGFVEIHRVSSNFILMTVPHH